MDDLIYFSSGWLSLYDGSLLDPDYQHSDWFALSLCDRWPNHINSRTGNLSTPWKLARTVAPLPDLSIHRETDFDRVFDQVTQDLVTGARDQGRRIHVCWSGGIDSTAILVALLRNGIKGDDITVLLSDTSIRENPYFYWHHVQDRFSVENIDQFRIDSSNYRDIMIVDGECGNQCLGSTGIHTAAHQKNFDALSAPWRDVTDLMAWVPGARPFAIDLINTSIDLCPVDIVTIYDWLWWSNFNFKVDDNLIKKMGSYMRDLKPEQRREFWTQGVFRPWARPETWAWSMLTLDQRSSQVRLDAKYAAKKYIHSWDRNDFFMHSKREEISTSRSLNDTVILTHPGCLDRPREWQQRQTDHVFAIDQHWNFYSILDPGHRRALGDILHKK